MDKNWWRVLAGLLVIAAGIVLFLQQMGWVAFTGDLWGALALLAGAVIFLSLWLSNRAEWWPLIPGSVMLGWGVATLLGMIGLPDWLGTLIGFAGSALPFLYIFFRLGAQKGWWALIPGGVLGAWGLGTVLGDLGMPDGVVSLVGFLGSAVPFLFIFAMDRKKNWWALIPGGIMAFMGVVTVLGTLVGEEWTATLILWGIALVFAGIFLANRRDWWPLIPAGVMAVVGFGVSPVAASAWVIGPVLLILVGIFLVVRTVLRRE